MAEETKSARENAAAGARGRMAEDFLRAFSELEHGMESLKARLTEAGETDERLSRRAQELEARSTEVESRLAEVHAERAALDVRVAEADTERQAIETRRRALDGDVAALKLLVDQNEAHERDVASRESALSQRGEELESRQAALAVAQNALAKREAAIVEEAAAAEVRHRELVERLERAEHTITSLRTELADAQAEVALVVEARQAIEARASELEGELEAARRSADDAVAAAGELRAQAEQERASSASKLAGAEEQLRALNAKLQEVQKHDSALKLELERQKVVLKRRESDSDALTLELASVRRTLVERLEEIETLRLDVQSREEAAAELRAQIDGLRTGAQADQSGVAAKVAEWTARVSELSAKLAEATAARDEAVRACAELTRRVEEAAQRDQQRGAALDTDKEVQGALQESLDVAIHERDQARAEFERVAAELESARQQQATGGDRVAALEQDCAGFHAEVRTLKDAVAARELAIEKLYAQCEELERRCEALQSAEKSSELATTMAGLGGGPSHSSEVMDARTARRRERLGRARVLVREQSRKVRLASEALRTRFEQCDQVLAVRSEVVEAKRTVIEAQRRMQRQRAGSRVAAMVCYALFSLVLLGGLSLGISRQVAPGLYAARATLKADGAGRELSIDEKGEWTRYHEKLFSDPQLMSEASERMKRRGIESLATPAQLTEFVSSSLVHESPEPGVIQVELRAPGSERALRVLETFLTAMASQSNATRMSRVDGAVTVMAQPPSVGVEPIDNQQLMYAGIFAGGGFVVVFAGAGLLWVRLANARQKFEGESRVDAVLESAAWATPEPVQRKAAPKSAAKADAGFHDI